MQNNKRRFKAKGTFQLKKNLIITDCVDIKKEADLFCLATELNRFTSQSFQALSGLVKLGSFKKQLFLGSQQKVIFRKI